MRRSRGLADGNHFLLPARPTDLAGIFGYARHRPTTTRPQPTLRSGPRRRMPWPPNPLARAFESTRAVLAGIGPDQLELPTPCQSWNVADAINHMNAAARFGANAVATGEGVRDEQDFAGGDVSSCTTRPLRSPSKRSEQTVCSRR